MHTSKINSSHNSDIFLILYIAIDKIQQIIPSAIGNIAFKPFFNAHFMVKASQAKSFPIYSQVKNKAIAARKTWPIINQALFLHLGFFVRKLLSPSALGLCYRPILFSYWLVFFVNSLTNLIERWIGSWKNEAHIVLLFCICKYSGFVFCCLNIKCLF